MAKAYARYVLKNDSAAERVGVCEACLNCGFTRAYDRKSASYLYEVAFARIDDKAGIQTVFATA
jgi:hypothetical protein